MHCRAQGHPNLPFLYLPRLPTPPPQMHDLRITSFPLWPFISMSRQSPSATSVSKISLTSFVSFLLPLPPPPHTHTVPTLIQPLPLLSWTSGKNTPDCPHASHLLGLHDTCLSWFFSLTNLSWFSFSFSLLSSRPPVLPSCCSPLKFR